MMEGAKQCEQSGESSQALTAGRTEKGLFLDDRLHFLGVCCGAYIQQYVMGPVGGLCVGVIIDEAVYKIRMARFVKKGGVPSKPKEDTGTGKEKK